MGIEDRRFRDLSSWEGIALAAMAEIVKPLDFAATLQSIYLAEASIAEEREDVETQRVFHAASDVYLHAADALEADWGTPSGAIGPFGQEVDRLPGALVALFYEPDPVEGRSLGGFLSRLFTDCINLDRSALVRLAGLFDALEIIRDRATRFRMEESLTRRLDEAFSAIESDWAAIRNPRFDYKAYLLSPEWKARRDERVRAAGGRCQVCNNPKNLNVHHRTYERIGNEDPDDLFVLCQPCHEMFHRNGRLARPM